MWHLLKTSTVAVFLFLSQAAFAERVVVISDVDDTIKISHVRNPIEMISYALFPDSLFYGMDQSYRAIKRLQEDAKFFYISNGWTPTVQEVHQKLLRNFNFPKGEYISRDNPLVKTHKLDRIREILLREKPDVVILVGDNGEKDSTIYQQIVSENRGSKIKFNTFIHRVYDPENEKESSSSKGQFEFLNSAEFAYLLMESGLIDSKSAGDILENVTRAIENQSPHAVYGALVMPYFQSCLSTGVPFLRQCRSALQSIFPFQSQLRQIQKIMCTLK